MQEQELTDDGSYKVVVNHEEQYSIWSAERELPAGWRDAGVTGSRKACLEHISKVWTDMRPSSVRKATPEATTRSVAVKA